MRPIDADAIHATITGAFSDGHDDPNGQLLSDIINEISTISRDDIIGHGRWELIDKEPWDFYPGTGWRCSECGKELYLVTNTPEGNNYCSNCGAKMDSYVDLHLPTKSDMEKIRRYCQINNADDVFVFEIKLATNEVDKDYEYFSAECLWQMQWFFLGMAGILGYDWNSMALPVIFETRVEESDTIRTKCGNRYMVLIAKAFLLRTKANEQFIVDIEKGQLSEVSIGLSVKRKVCNICGKPQCEHKLGEEYHGKMCCKALCEPQEVYEWAFVEPTNSKSEGEI